MPSPPAAKAGGAPSDEGLGPFTVGFMTERDELIALAVSDAHVYWLAGGAIRRAPRLGGPSELFVEAPPKTSGASASERGSHLAVHGGYLYFDEGTTKLVRKPLAGGPSSPVATLSDPTASLAVDDDGVFVCDERVLMRVEEGGALRRLATERDVYGCGDIALDGEHVWTARMNTVVRVPKVGGEPVAFASDEVGAKLPVFDADHVYWGSGTGLRVAPRSGGAASSLSGIRGRPVGVTSDHVLVESYDELFAVPKRGGADALVDKGWGRVVAARAVKGRTFIATKQAVRSVPESAVFVAPPAPSCPALPTATTSGETLVAPAKITVALAVDETNVYFTERFTGLTSKAPKTGGPVEKIAESVRGPERVAIDRDTIYVAVKTYEPAEKASLLAIKKSGGPATELFSAKSLVERAVTTDDAFVYFGVGSEIARMPKGGGAKSAVARVSQRYYSSPLIEGDSLFGVAASDVAFRVPKAGGAVVALGVTDGAMTIDRGYAYFRSGGRWARLPIAGGAAEYGAALPENVNLNGQAVADERALYASGSSKGGFAVYAFPKGGGCPTVVVQKTEEIGPVAVDDAWLYFGTESGVFRVKKPG